jgi:hypothetical protein
MLTVFEIMLLRDEIGHKRETEEKNGKKLLTLSFVICILYQIFVRQ